MRPAFPTAGQGTAGFVLVAVLLTGTALLGLAAATSLLAWTQWGVARHQAEAQRARAVADGALLIAMTALNDEVARSGSVPLAPPTFPWPDGAEVRLVTYRPRSDGAVDLEIEAWRPPARARAGAVWWPP